MKQKKFSLLYTLSIDLFTKCRVMRISFVSNFSSMTKLLVFKIIWKREIRLCHGFCRFLYLLRGRKGVGLFQIEGREVRVGGEGGG